MAKIYFDVCCLGRPYDDQSQDRVRIEAHAVLELLERVRLSQDYWVTSDVVFDEISRDNEPFRRERLFGSLEYSSSIVDFETSWVPRVHDLIALGFCLVDALHLRCAESANCDVLLTTDDKFHRLGQRHSDKMLVRIANPIEWLHEFAET